MTEEKPGGEQPQGNQPQGGPTQQPQGSEKPSDPGLKPPALVLVQEGHSPVRETKPNPNVNAPGLVKVQEFERRDSKQPASEAQPAEKTTKEK